MSNVKHSDEIDMERQQLELIDWAQQQLELIDIGRHELELIINALLAAIAVTEGPEPRDLALRAFADAITTEMWAYVKRSQPPQGRASSDLEVMLSALDTLRAALMNEG